MIWIPVVGTFLGLMIGILINVPFPARFDMYVALLLLSLLATLFGGIRASLENTFHTGICLSGFGSNLILALTLAFLGQQIGVDLYLAAVFALGLGLFKNLSQIVRLCMPQKQA
ncbi:DUF1290 domain-containing protein [Salsuginibacillus kocurii]|uniref:DUF1290 domain-containing protein n=1 Tax=Salsuginibacillus kocurii TaxID=427078 RepID=UPI00036054A6|nr:DUF1290 domain-containing protein [Salsuginibacillus kocurii]